MTEREWYLDKVYAIETEECILYLEVDPEVQEGHIEHKITMEIEVTVDIRDTQANPYHQLEEL